MRNINDAYAQFSTLFGGNYPLWDRDSLHDYLLEQQPDWMHLSHEEFQELLDRAYNAAFAEVEEEEAAYLAQWAR